MKILPVSGGNGARPVIGPTGSHIVPSRIDVAQFARNPQRPEGTGSHAITKKPIPPHFDRPPVLHHPGNGCRDGYYAYQAGWLDCFFAFDFYFFEYNANACVASPWYYYPDEPAYVNIDRTSPETAPGTEAFQPFDWRSPTEDQPGSNAYYLDTAIGELVSVYEDEDVKALDALVPSGYKVSVNLDGGDGYDLSSDDFHDLMLDNATTTKTEGFAIAGVYVAQDEAKVLAIHTFTKPDGTTERLLHTYVLDRTPSGYVISSIKVTQAAPAF